MAGRRAITKAPPLIPSNSLVASAIKYPGQKMPDRIFRNTEAWQTEAWKMYDITPELRFAAGWIGNALSRVTLFPGQVGPDGKVEPSTDTQTATELNALFSGSNGQAQMLNALGVHLTVAGEAYLVGRQVEGEDVWEVIGITEIEVAGGDWTIKYGENNDRIPLAADDTVIRIWNPHPARRYEADSHVRSLLPVLREIEWLTRHVFAQITSRLAGAGVWVLPQSVQFPPAPGEEAAQNAAEGIMRLLSQAMMDPLKNPDSPSALVPITITVPDDAVDKVREAIHFWTPLDASVTEMRKAAVNRFAVGMDIPPEILLGMTSGSRSSGGTGSGASHWTAWQIEESAIKLHIEPLMELIVNAITVSYLRPLLAEGSKNAVGYDTTRLKLQPDRSKEAFELFDRGELNGDSLRAYNGMDATDAPTDDERKIMAIRKIATGSATPDQVAGALKLLGIELPEVLVPDSGAIVNEAPNQVRDTPSTPSLEGHPAPRSAPEGAALHPALVPTSEALVLRALERAGNRLRAKGAKPPCPTSDTHRYVQVNGSAAELLSDAWTHVPTVMAGIADPAKVTAVLNAYCESLFTEQAPHTREKLARYLTLVD